MPDQTQETEPQDDAAQVSAIRAGDARRFEVLVRKYNPRVFRIARGILGNDAEAEEACQDAFVSAYAKLDQLRDPRRFGGWVCRIAARSALRRAKERAQVRAAVDSASEGVGDPERALQLREVRDVLARAVDSLPPGYRSVFVMRDVEEMSTQEVADTLELEPGAVRVRLHRARAMLRETVGDQWTESRAELFAFAGARCDRIAAAVLARIE